MIAALTGIVREKRPTQVVLDVSGIAFELTVPLSTSRALNGAGAAGFGSEASSREAPVTLLVQSVFTREGMRLYGFATHGEKDIFNRLTAIPGIGPKVALNLLSRFLPGEVTSILDERRIETLKTVPGIGPKKAERILSPPGRGARPMAAPKIADAKTEQALTALTALGLTHAEALKRLEQIPNRLELELNEMLTQALKHRE